MAPQIRPIAVCVFQNAGRILVGHGYDAVTQEHFYRPLGGALEFCESAADALRREILEEVDAEIAEPRLLGVLENVFTYEGAPGHEIVFVFDARFVEAQLYARPHLVVTEGGWNERATWESLTELARSRQPLYPEGLLTLL